MENIIDNRKREYDKNSKSLDETMKHLVKSLDIDVKVEKHDEKYTNVFYTEYLLQSMLHSLRISNTSFNIKVLYNIKEHSNLSYDDIVKYISNIHNFIEDFKPKYILFGIDTNQVVYITYSDILPDKVIMLNPDVISKMMSFDILSMFNTIIICNDSFIDNEYFDLIDHKHIWYQEQNMFTKTNITNDILTITGTDLLFILKHWYPSIYDKIIQARKNAKMSLVDYINSEEYLEQQKQIEEVNILFEINNKLDNLQKQINSLTEKLNEPIPLNNKDLNNYIRDIMNEMKNN